METDKPGEAYLIIADMLYHMKNSRNGDILSLLNFPAFVRAKDYLDAVDRGEISLADEKIVMYVELKDLDAMEAELNDL